MAKPKHDYSGEAFLKKIEELAKKGYTDKEIAYEVELTQTYFSDLKRESDVISEALARGRAKINNIVRQRFLAVALGGLKVKTITKQKSKFSDMMTDQGLGDMIVHETETELAPNLSALGTWLFNHDEEWRKQTIDGKKLDITSDGKEINANPLVFVSANELSEDQLQGLIKAQIGEDNINADSSNDTSS
ncbi:hypothetical protein [Sphingobacterium faecium]|uniref:hypothetical protein n=1 Tax=Sphingobacterium faecium TaxID=34087 RepID=UPI002479C7F5|nr:hypothetical protein [Sphingobacterium faecium]WGQ15593.1 hypothetical protein QG727_04105 [Sphingobacterium faecium]